MRSGSPKTRRLGALALVALTATACRPGPADILRLSQANAPFERLPYVQAVDTAGAVLVWRAVAPAVDSVRFRAASGEAWRAAEVERLPVEGRPSYPGLPDRVADRRARLWGLPPGGEVEYAVFVDTVAFGPASFRTAPRPGEGGVVRVLAFGDSGWGSASQLRLARLMELRTWDLAVHTGDIAYSDGSELDFTLRHFHVYQRLLAAVPFFPSPGNHDLRTEGGRPYDRAFEWPAPRPGARYYGFRWGDVQFFALDSSGEAEEEEEELRSRRGPQYAWLRAALDSVARDPTVRWTVAYLHHPPYSNATGFSGHGSDLPLRRALAPLFDLYGVDLVLAGHDHHYERSHPIRAGRAVRPGCGPVYVVTGGGGATRFARDIAPSPASATVSREHHFLSLRISSRAIDGEAIGENGGAIDGFRVLPYPGGPRPPPGCE